MLYSSESIIIGLLKLVILLFIWRKHRTIQKVIVLVIMGFNHEIIPISLPSHPSLGRRSDDQFSMCFDACFGHWRSFGELSRLLAWYCLNFLLDVAPIRLRELALLGRLSEYLNRHISTIELDLQLEVPVGAIVLNESSWWCNLGPNFA